MKKIFTILLSAMTIGAVSAQTVTSAEITACRLGASGLKIVYNSTANCNAAGTFDADTNLGFHSGGGATPWATVVTWDAGNALQAVRSGDTDFVVTIEDVAAYYGTAVEVLGLVFNQGATNPNSPWDRKGEGLKDDGACGDLFVVGVSALPACTSSNNDISASLGMSISPNPTNGVATLTFSNTKGEIFDMTVSTITGQVVRAQRGLNTGTVTIESNDMAPGLYFVTLRNGNGKFATQKLIVE